MVRHGNLAGIEFRGHGPTVFDAASASTVGTFGRGSSAKDDQRENGVGHRSGVKQESLGKLGKITLHPYHQVPAADHGQDPLDLAVTREVSSIMDRAQVP